MVSEESRRAIYHEFKVLAVLPILMTLTWFLFTLVRVDPPFFYYGLAVIGLMLCQYHDSQFPDNNNNLNVLLVRWGLSVLFTLIGVIGGGFLGLIFGSSSPTNPFSFLGAAFTFSELLSLTHLILISYTLFTRFDMAAIRGYFSTSGGDGDAPPRD